MVIYPDHCYNYHSLPLLLQVSLGPGHLCVLRVPQAACRSVTHPSELVQQSDQETAAGWRPGWLSKGQIFIEYISEVANRDVMRTDAHDTIQCYNEKIHISTVVCVLVFFSLPQSCGQWRMLEQYLMESPFLSLVSVLLPHSRFNPWVWQPDQMQWLIPLCPADIIIFTAPLIYQKKKVLM